MIAGMALGFIVLCILVLVEVEVDADVEDDTGKRPRLCGIIRSLFFIFLLFSASDRSITRSLYSEAV